MSGRPGERTGIPSSTRGRTGAAWTAALLGGAILWLGAAALGGRREAWDSTWYWILAYPASIGLAGSLGYWMPQRPWRWGIAVMWVQAVVLAFSSSGLTLLPLGLVVFSILALPAIVTSTLLARLRCRRTRSAPPERA